MMIKNKINITSILVLILGIAIGIGISISTSIVKAQTTSPHAQWLQAHTLALSEFKTAGELKAAKNLNALKNLRASKELNTLKQAQTSNVNLLQKDLSKTLLKVNLLPTKASAVKQHLALEKNLQNLVALNKAHGKLDLLKLTV